MRTKISIVENEIDESFAANPLVRLPFAQCAWTLLSALEDQNFKMTFIDQVGPGQLRANVDVLINALTHPLRVCFRRSEKGCHQFSRRLVGKHYSLAHKWLQDAEDYSNFCTLFSLYHLGEIDLTPKNGTVAPSDWSRRNLVYEAYDRVVEKGNPKPRPTVGFEAVFDEVGKNTTIRRKSFSVDFSRSLVGNLVGSMRHAQEYRFVLPDSWQFKSFSLGEFRRIVCCIQSMAIAWFIARRHAVEGGSLSMAYASGVWTPTKAELPDLLTKLTGERATAVRAVLDYMTFGQQEIRSPDIATQPILDLSNGQYAISPFVLMNVDLERNLCVLLNKIPEERKLYARLVDEKELIVQRDVIKSLSSLGLDFRVGQIDETDVDLAIIDRQAKNCICIEIKWFIEPAEIREVYNRAKDIEKGVRQARTILGAFQSGDDRLLQLLDIDESYDFLATVGSVNFVGGEYCQSAEVPVVKLWHLVDEIQRQADLGTVITWLRARNYLPVKMKDYEIHPVEFDTGNWKSSWYGIKLL